MTRPNASIFALLGVVTLVSGCTRPVGSNSALPQPAAVNVGARQTAAGRLVGPGAIVTSKFGGPIFGWAIDENGNDGVLTEATRITAPYTSYVETFDQTTAKIVAIARKEKSGLKGNHELFADAIQANDVGLIDNELRHYGGPFRDAYYVMAPVTGNKVTGAWKQPRGKDFLLYDIADQQVDPASVMAITVLDGTITRPPKFEVIVTNVAANKILHVLRAPSTDGVNYPYFVAEDTSTHQAYVPAANFYSQTIFIDFDVRSGYVSDKFVAPPFSGPVNGIAVDSSTHAMCTTTTSNFSIEIYDLKSKQQTFAGPVPNAGGELQGPSEIAADPVHHLFLVEQPQSLLGGSEIYVYDEKGNLLESLRGFNFINGSGIQVIASARTGYVAGPGANELQSFTY